MFDFEDDEQKLLAENKESKKQHKITDEGFVRFELILHKDEKKEVTQIIKELQKEDPEMTSRTAFMKIITQFKTQLNEV